MQTRRSHTAPEEWEAAWINLRSGTGMVPASMDTERVVRRQDCRHPAGGEGKRDTLL